MKGVRQGHSGQTAPNLRRHTNIHKKCIFLQNRVGGIFLLLTSAEELRCHVGHTGCPGTTRDETRARPGALTPLTVGGLPRASRRSSTPCRKPAKQQELISGCLFNQALACTAQWNAPRPTVLKMPFRLCTSGSPSLRVPLFWFSLRQSSALLLPKL